jgi:hypothetical protein
MEYTSALKFMRPKSKWPFYKKTFFFVDDEESRLARVFVLTV